MIQFGFVEFVCQFLIFLLQQVVLAFQAIILHSFISDFVAKHSIAHNKHQNDDGHEARDDDDC